MHTHIYTARMRRVHVHEFVQARNRAHANVEWKPVPE